MDSFNEFFKKLFAQIGAFWASLTTVKKAIVAGGIFAVIIGIGVFTSQATKKTYEYLFVNISDEDQNEISAYLKSINFNDFIIDNKGIRVTSDELLRLRLQLTQEGLPTQGNVGWEKFDQQDFARTEFEQKIQKNRAIQGEISRTINAIKGVTSSRVHIVVPSQSVFLRDKKDPTASIYIKTKTGTELSKKQVKGIQHLVSRAVEGLHPDKVTIIDFEGKLLTEPENDDYTGKFTKERTAYTTQIEKGLEDKIQTIVGRVVGVDRVEAKVHATVDFTQEKQTLADVDPDDVAVTSKNTSGMSMEGSGLNPTGIPGAKSNVPGEQENVGMGGGSKTGSKKETELINFDVSKLISEKVLPVGNVIRLTAAVIVDGRQGYPSDGSTPNFEPRTPEEMKNIEELVKKAIGFKDGRDDVTVSNMMFQLDPIQTEQIMSKKQENRDYISTLAVSATVALALILFFAFIVRPYFRWLSYDPEQKKKQASIEEFKADLESNKLQNVQIQEEVPFEKLSPQEQILFLARNEPKRTVEAIRMLLNPNNTAGS